MMQEAEHTTAVSTSGTDAKAAGLMTDSFGSQISTTQTGNDGAGFSSTGQAMVAAPLLVTVPDSSVSNSVISSAAGQLPPAPSVVLPPFQQPISSAVSNQIMAGVSTGPPKTGFQPVHQSPVPTVSAAKTASQSSTRAGVNIFTPSFDPNAPLSPYAAATPSLQQQYQPSTPSLQQQYQPSTYANPPGVMQTPHEASTSIQVSIDPSLPESAYHQPLQYQTSQDGSLLEWIKNHETVNKMMQKAKAGVETVITAMDPQMRDVLYSGGDINVVVASTKDVKVEPVKLAFQNVFGRATVTGQASQPSIAPQPVGFAAGIRGAEQRIENLRRNRHVHERQAVVAIESFIVDLQPDRWYDISCLLLKDPCYNIELQTFSQATPVSIEYVKQAQTETPQDYNLLESGLAVTVGQVMNRQCAVDPSDWHYYFTGVSRKDTISIAAKQLAHMYQQRIPRQH